jgi:hypothetical protein
MPEQSVKIVSAVISPRLRKVRSKSRRTCNASRRKSSRPQVLGEGLLRFHRRAGRGDNSRLYKKSGDGGQAVWTDAIEAHVPRSRVVEAHARNLRPDRLSARYRRGAPCLIVAGTLVVQAAEFKAIRRSTESAIRCQAVYEHFGARYSGADPGPVSTYALPG